MSLWRGSLRTSTRCQGGLARVWQEGAGEEATLVFITHRAQEGAFQKTIEELRELEAVRAVASLLRVEGEEG